MAIGASRNSPLQKAQSLGQSIWCDDISRNLIKSGRLEDLISRGVTGLTTNPTIFEKALNATHDYDLDIARLVASGKSNKDIFEELSIFDVQKVADALMEIYTDSNYTDGYVSYELSPNLADDTAASVEEALRLFSLINRPNLMIKVPATSSGIEALRKLISLGINTNVTLIFNVDTYEAVVRSYLSGLEDLVANGGDPSKVFSVASFFLARVDAAIDGVLKAKKGAAGNLNKSAISNAKIAYQKFTQHFSSPEFNALKLKGAMVQKPLWASTATKDPGLKDTFYFEELIAESTVMTMPEGLLKAVLDHAQVEKVISPDSIDPLKQISEIKKHGVDIEAVTSDLLAAGLESFAKSYTELITTIDRKRHSLNIKGYQSLFSHSQILNPAYKQIEQENIISRIWSHDHKLWHESPREIIDRLGWLEITKVMTPRINEICSFAHEINQSDFDYVVLLAMGGSAFAPELFSQIFKATRNHRKFYMLDSTHPDWVKSVSESIVLEKTLFIVSSKSGSTIEVDSFYLYFRDLIEQHVGSENAGKHFVAITDTSTPLAQLAKAQNFRKVFLNPENIGGRFSCLSFFGLVPSALQGIDVKSIITNVETMIVKSKLEDLELNEPARLAATIAAFSAQGIDKLVIITSPSLSTMGVWTEQLIAESLGKEGGDVIPIAGEPLLDPDSYGNDRLFVYIKLATDDNKSKDLQVEKLMDSGNPVICIELEGPAQIGAELYKWEFATAVIGALKHVHVFNQPDVQAAKDFAQNGLNFYMKEGQLIKAPEVLSVVDLFSLAKPGDYVSFLIYLSQTSSIDTAINRIREVIAKKFKLATSAGYGPRYLHSTGQLHKAGPNKGLFIQLVEPDSNSSNEVEISGAGYSFRVLNNAQANGDLIALVEQSRRVSRVFIAGTPEQTIEALSNQVLSVNVPS